MKTELSGIRAHSRDELDPNLPNRSMLHPVWQIRSLNCTTEIDWTENDWNFI